MTRVLNTLAHHCSPNNLDMTRRRCHLLLIDERGRRLLGTGLDGGAVAVRSIGVDRRGNGSEDRQRGLVNRDSGIEPRIDLGAAFDGLDATAVDLFSLSPGRTSRELIAETNVLT